MTEHDDDVAVVREALEGVGLWAASISEPSAAVEEGVTNALVALDRLRVEVAALREAGEGLCRVLERNDLGKATRSLWREATSSGAGTLPESVPPQKGDSRDSQPSPPAPDDVGPPAPGEGDDLPNPEAGMGC